jgi:hypothetical protein
MESRSLVSVVLVALSIAGCSGAAATAAPTDPPTPPPTASPVPATPTPVPTTAAADFTLTILPVEEPVESRVAIPGEKVSFLVMVESSDGSPVTIEAAALGAQVTAIEPAQLTPGVVGEVWVVPDQVTDNATVEVDFSAVRGGATMTDTRSIVVWPMADERTNDAKPYFEMWTAWLVASHPELGITAATSWDPTFVSTFLVVSHYAYFSDEWEMKVSWHNMIPPDDWTEVYLRHRGTESAPSLAFRIDSVAGKTGAHPVTPPEAIMR